MRCLAVLFVLLLGATQLFGGSGLTFELPTLTVVGSTTAPTTTELAMSFADPDQLGLQTQGFTCGIALDLPTTITEAVPTGQLADLQFGSGPSFFSVVLALTGGSGITIGCVFTTHSPIQTIEFPAVAEPVVILTVQHPPLVTPAESTPLTLSSTLGTPTVLVGYVLGGMQLFPTAIDGELTVVAPQFVRGDSNGDGASDIGDAIFTLSFLFAGGDSARCADALDANDDGLVDVSDAVYTTNWLFLDGSSPAEPWPSCGSDPTADDLPCGLVDGCFP